MQYTVLLVDDEPNVLEGLGRALYMEPYKLCCVSSADEALDFLRDERVDVVVSDQDMPGTLGTEFLTKVRQWYPSTVRFMLTGKGTRDVAIQAINEGAVSEFFMKPCNNFELAVALGHAIQQQALLREYKELARGNPREVARLKQWEEEYPRIMKVPRSKEMVEGLRSQSEESLFRAALDILSRKAAEEVLLGISKQGLIRPAPVLSIQEDPLQNASFVFKWEYSSLFLCIGEEVLVFFHVAPLQRYIIRTHVDAIDINRLKGSVSTKLTCIAGKMS